MIMGPSPEYVKKQLQLADEALSDAKYLLEGGRLKAAAQPSFHTSSAPKPCKTHDS